MSEPKPEFLIDASQYLVAMGFARAGQDGTFECGCRIGHETASICDRHEKALAPAAKPKRKRA